MFSTQELPAPKPEGPEVWPEVLARFAAPEHAALRAELEARRDLGIARYGQTVHRDDGRPLGVDAFQELADALVYLQRDRMREDASDHPGGDLALDLDETITRIRQSLIVLHRILFWDDIGRRTVRFGLTPMQRAKIAAALERGAYWSTIAEDIGWEVETLKKHYTMETP